MHACLSECLTLLNTIYCVLTHLASTRATQLTAGCYVARDESLRGPTAGRYAAYTGRAATGGSFVACVPHTSSGHHLVGLVVVWARRFGSYRTPRRGAATRHKYQIPVQSSFMKPRFVPCGEYFLPEVREFIRDAKPRTNTTRGGRGAIRRPHYPTVRPERQQRIGLLGERPQAPARSGGG